MISLLLTLFISVFSFCPSINRLEDHNENTIIYDTGIHEKSINANDEYGIQLYMAKAEFFNNNFIVDFIGAIAGSEGSQYNYISYANDSLGSVTLDSGGSFYTYVNGYITNTKISNCTGIILTKASAELINNPSGDPSILTSYYLYFYNGPSVLLQFFYRIAYPLLDNYEHDLGVCCYYFDIVRNFSEPFWFYFENTLDDTPCPLINYYYDIYVGNKVNIVNTNYNRGYNDGRSYGYQTGYNQALEDTQAYDTTASTIFNGALEIGLLPVNFFLSIFNFEVFGINIKSIVSALLTLAVVIIIVRFLFGGKENDK